MNQLTKEQQVRWAKANNEDKPRVTRRQINYTSHTVAKASNGSVNHIGKR